MAIETRRVQNLELDVADFTLHTNVLLEKQFMRNSIFYISATAVCNKEESSFDKDFIVDSGSLMEEVKASEVQAVFRLTPYFAVHEDKRISVFLFVGIAIPKRNFEADCIIDYLNGVKVAEKTFVLNNRSLNRVWEANQDGGVKVEQKSFVPGNLSLTHRVRETNQNGNLTDEALRPDKQLLCEILNELCLNIEGLAKCDGPEEGFYNIAEPLRKQFQELREAYDILFINLHPKTTGMRSMQNGGKIEITCMKCKALISTHEYTAWSTVDKKCINNFTMCFVCTKNNRKRKIDQIYFLFSLSNTNHP